eukprot:CAMPEP_0172499448 /NCGR_PEP_ID=MMETSP1066-20121228/127347_1 /TAXON_ID=671091 /ORGANISM="Coscinodiscus wailesii, Strain CCMP2513" /LENGTH=443 /DNA_ID=CAMNT_0013273203 /DNA_START=8 /DNA_END=1339 /DNA_ORIENTATION=+
MKNEEKFIVSAQQLHPSTKGTKKKVERNFCGGSLFSFSVYVSKDKPAVINVSKGAFLCVNTASLIADNNNSATSPLSLYLSSNANDDFIFLCQVEPGQTVTSLGIELCGPQVLKLQALQQSKGSKDCSSPINIFGSVTLEDDVSEGDEGDEMDEALAEMATMQQQIGKETNHNEDDSDDDDDDDDNRTEEKDEDAEMMDDATEDDSKNAENGSGKKENAPQSKPERTDADDKTDSVGADKPVSGSGTPKTKAERRAEKRERKKLAKQKAKELRDAVNKEQGYDKDKGDGPEGNDDEVDTTNDDKTPQKTKNKSSTPDNSSGKKSHLSERRLEGGVLVKDAVIGTGAEVKMGRKVSILYEGSLLSNGKVFDKNQDRKNPLTFRVGTGEVIRGLEKGLKGMKVGGVRTVTIPPAMGYGKSGAGGVIPGNATLLFDVTLLTCGGKR